jgi:hypothetical protein
VFITGQYFEEYEPVSIVKIVLNIGMMLTLCIGIDNEQKLIIRSFKTIRDICNEIVRKYEIFYFHSKQGHQLRLNN